MYLSFLVTILGGKSNLNSTVVKIRFLSFAYKKSQSFISGCQHLIECPVKEVHSLASKTSHL